VLPFENQIPFDEQIEDYYKTIATPEELSGLLNFALEGLYRLKQNHGYSEHRTLDEIRDMMTSGKNPPRDFITAYIKNDTNEETKEHIYNCYRHYCMINSYPLLASNTFSRRMKEYGPFTMSEGQTRQMGKTWKGIKCSYEIPTDNQQEKLNVIP
jgi:putative DNA primase/helicase